MEIHIVQVNVQDLEGLGLELSVWDTLTDREATVTTAVEKDENKDEDYFGPLEDGDIIQYVNHELRNASVEYSDDGLIQENRECTIESQSTPVAIPDVESLIARIQRINGGYYFEVTSKGNIVYEHTVTDGELGLKSFEL